MTGKRKDRVTSREIFSASLQTQRSAISHYNLKPKGTDGIEIRSEIVTQSKVNVANIKSLLKPITIHDPWSHQF